MCPVLLSARTLLTERLKNSVACWPALRRRGWVKQRLPAELGERVWGLGGHASGAWALAEPRTWLPQPPQTLKSKSPNSQPQV